MKIIYDKYQEMYIIALEELEAVTCVNTKDIVEAREVFIKAMTRLFNDTICKRLDDNKEVRQ
jgi:hypothetical protein